MRTLPIEDLNWEPPNRILLPQLFWNHDEEETGYTEA